MRLISVDVSLRNVRFPDNRGLKLTEEKCTAFLALVEEYKPSSSSHNSSLYINLWDINKPTIV